MPTDQIFSSTRFIPEEDQPRILEAALFMDNNECETVISAGLAYRSTEAQIRDAENMNEAAKAFGEAAVAVLGREGEWK